MFVFLASSMTPSPHAQLRIRVYHLYIPIYRPIYSYIHPNSGGRQVPQLWDRLMGFRLNWIEKRSNFTRQTSRVAFIESRLRHSRNAGTKQSQNDYLNPYGKMFVFLASSMTPSPRAQLRIRVYHLYIPIYKFTIYIYLYIDLYIAIFIPILVVARFPSSEID